MIAKITDSSGLDPIKIRIQRIEISMSDDLLLTVEEDEDEARVIISGTGEPECLFSIIK